MSGNQQLLLPSSEKLASAYEAFFANQRKVLSIKVSCKQKKFKWIVEYLVTYFTQHGTTVQEQIIGKVYSDADRGMAAYQLMKYLWDNGMGATSNQTIVQPIAFFPAEGLFLMSKAPGKTLDEVLFTTEQGDEASVHVANLLTRLHSIPVNQISQAKNRRAEADMTRFISELTQKVPDHAVELVSVYEALCRKMAKVSAGPSVLLHGDFHLQNVFVEGQCVTAIDFDHYFIGDPAWDVAYLACQIQLNGFYKKGDFHLFDHIVTKIFETYLNAAPSLERELFLERSQLYRSRSLLESLHYELCVCQTEKWEIIEPFLIECKHSLDRKGFM